MATGQIPSLIRQKQHPYMLPRDRYPNLADLRFGIPRKRQALQSPMDPQREFWIERTKDAFHQLILLGERQPSNGTVRRVETPDGETRFAVAYGSEPDEDLQALLEKIYAKHGEVSLLHGGRDSTGKHWIKCVSKVRRDTWEITLERAIICVSSKLELATVPGHQAREIPGKGKGKAPRDNEQWPPKIPGAVKGAPEHLFLMPWYMQLPWLEPAAAQALREKVGTGGVEFQRRRKALREAQFLPRD